MRVEGPPSSRRPRHPLSESDQFNRSPYSPSHAFGFGELVEELGGAGQSGAVRCRSGAVRCRGRGGRERRRSAALRCGGGGERAGGGAERCGTERFGSGREAGRRFLRERRISSRLRVRSGANRRRIHPYNRKVSMSVHEVRINQRGEALRSL